MLKTSKTQLTHARLVEVLNYDPGTGFFIRKRSMGPRKDIAGHIDTKGHRQIMVDGVLHMAHRLAWLYVYKKHPDQMLDHINRNPDDNRIINLRLANNSQNQQNSKTRSDNVCGIKGVQFIVGEKKWRSRISIHGKTKCLGRYDTLEKAVEARRLAEASMFTHHKELT
jgi:hypothetical protein